MHADLIARLEKLDGPDRRVDALIADACTPSLYPGWMIHPQAEGKDDFTAIPTYTASLDAAVALFRRVFPEWSLYMQDHCSDQPGAWAHYSVGDGKRVPDAPFIFVGPNLAISVCIATLTALSSSDSKR